MNGIELFERIQQVATFDELLQSVNGKTKSDTQSKRGNVFEKVWDIIIKFGFYSILPNDIYDHYEGNINTCKLKKVADLEIYLRDISVFSKGKGGSSDITLQNKNNGKWVFMSSKFYLDDSKKSIDNYDVEKILAIVKQHSHKYKECDIYLVVNNKQKVMNIITSSQATNNYIKENIHHILDLEDLEICFQNLKHSIQEITINEVKFGCNRDVLIAFLDEKGIETRPFFIPIHTLPPYQDSAKNRGCSLPVTELISKSGINLPTSSKMNQTEIIYICDMIKECRDSLL